MYTSEPVSMSARPLSVLSPTANKLPVLPLPPEPPELPPVDLLWSLLSPEPSVVLIASSFDSSAAVLAAAGVDF